MAAGNLTKHPPMNSLLMIPLLTAAGLGCFWLFYKSVGFFDHI